MNKRAVPAFMHIALFLMLVLLFWTGFALLPSPSEVYLEDSSLQDLTGVDFISTIYRSYSCWESWPDVFYAPADFADGTAMETGLTQDKMDYGVTQYATHRVRFMLAPGQTYGLSMKSADYSMRIFINGVLVDSVGVPGETREDTTPRTLKTLYYFVAETGEVEIILHMANFVHRNGAYPPQFFIGSASNITRKDNADVFITTAMFICLITASLYHIGLFLVNRTRKTALLFAAVCLLISLLNYKTILFFIPEYNWFAAIRFEYINHYLIFAALTLFLETMYPTLLNRIVTRAFYLTVVVFIVITLATEPKTFSLLLYAFSAFSILLALYVITRMAKTLKNSKPQNALTFVGLLPVVLLGVFDILSALDIIQSAYFSIILPDIATPIGMVYLVFCYSLAVALDYADTERELLLTRMHEKELAETNAMMDRMDKLKSDIISTISHESRTPLAVLASYAGLVSMELKRTGVDEQIAADLDIVAFEAERVANLIDSMKEITKHKEVAATRTLLDIGDIIMQTTKLYEHIISRGNVMLETNVSGDSFPVYGNPAELTQVLFNLLQNAKNHTKSGKISVSATKENGFIYVIVEDTGSGIVPELLPRVFERGVSGFGGGTGYGLALCKEIVEGHGGEITIHNSQFTIHNESNETGTVVTIKLPVFDEESKENGYCDSPYE